MAASVAGANAASAINTDLTNADLRRRSRRLGHEQVVLKWSRERAHDPAVEE
jgi:hypothetical protein